MAQHSAEPSLSDQEMSRTRGSCACYEEEDLTYCNFYGSLNCSTGSGDCGDEKYRPHNNLLGQITTEGEPNAKEPHYEWVNCWTFSEVLEGDEPDWMYCKTGQPEGYNPEVHYAWWYSCQESLFQSSTCQQCSWGIDLEDPIPQVTATCEDI
jgi:hypothetical protein